MIRVVPEFVIEVLSLSDRLRAAQKKMRQWMANGVEPGWLIDGDNECVYIYRQGREMRHLRTVRRIEGAGPVEGFVMNLPHIREGL